MCNSQFEKRLILFFILSSSRELNIKRMLSIRFQDFLHLWRFKMPILMKIYYLYFFNFLLDFLDGFFTYTPSLLYEPINKFL